MQLGYLIRTGVLVLACCVSMASAGQAQRTLEEAAQRARYAWMVHDAGMLSSTADTLVLKLPGTDEQATANPSQAARMLNRFFQPSTERAFEFTSVRSTGEEQGYAEASRRYVVRGTTDVVAETVFLGFRRSGGRWRLTEIRVAP
jgi:hypothetical protein